MIGRLRARRVQQLVINAVITPQPQTLRLRGLQYHRDLPQRLGVNHGERHAGFIGDARQFGKLGLIQTFRQRRSLSSPANGDSWPEISASTISASARFSALSDRAAEATYPACPYGCCRPGADVARREARYPDRARRNGEERGRETMFLYD
jgi:hypothetical protein